MTVHSHACVVRVALASYNVSLINNIAKLDGDRALQVSVDNLNTKVFVCDYDRSAEVSVVSRTRHHNSVIGDRRNWSSIFSTEVVSTVVASAEVIIVVSVYRVVSESPLTAGIRIGSGCDSEPLRL